MLITNINYVFKYIRRVRSILSCTYLQITCTLISYLQATATMYGLSVSSIVPPTDSKKRKQNKSFCLEYTAGENRQQSNPYRL